MTPLADAVCFIDDDVRTSQCSRRARNMGCFNRSGLRYKWVLPNRTLSRGGPRCFHPCFSSDALALRPSH